MDKSTYYILESACNTVETGKVFPQVQKVSPKYDKQKENSIYRYLKKYNEIKQIPENVPDLDSFVLDGRAKPTDLISNAITASNGLFVSDKLKNILQKFDLPYHRFFQAKLSYKGQVLDNYFWFFFLPTEIKNIDFNKSSFFLYRSYLYNEGAIEINSEEDYFKKKKNVKEENPNVNITIWADKICLKTDFKPKELFSIGVFDTNVYINSELREKLLEQNITGCELKKTNRLIQI